jgi:VanZ family protein
MPDEAGSDLLLLAGRHDVFAAPMLLFVMPLVATWPRKWWVFVTAASLFGVAIEGLQMLKDRATELEDIVANCVGAGIGAALGLAVAWVWPQRSGRHAAPSGDRGPPPP